MRVVFADTGYWIALINPNDSLHHKARAASENLGPCRVVTSEMVLAEVLNMFADRGSHLRQVTVASVRAILADASIEVVPQTRRLFLKAFDLYEERLDKSWSVTDCASLVIIRDRDISTVLTHDHHFSQMGCVMLL